ncbi:hypothetical protein GF325_14360 [Candidatus Bathyarchaeota archaeon]|nr:hypothetical protein [Candidatus Bathyarchaeota archaeon]
MVENERLSREEEMSEGLKTGQEIPLGSFIGMFLASCWFSLLPPITVVYLLVSWLQPIRYLLGISQPWVALMVFAILILAFYIALIFSTWFVAKVSLRLVTRNKPLAEGVFHRIRDADKWMDFTKRHIVKKFSMWFFKKCTPRWLYRKYVGSFIKLGKHVEIPKWIAMEGAEIGDNTVFARHTTLASHLIDGETISIKHVTVGKNCIFDAEDELNNVTLLPGCIVEDNVILKPGTLLKKGMRVKEGGIYQGVMNCERVGEVADLSPEEIEQWRNKVRNNSQIYSKMIRQWSSFSSCWPRFYKYVSILTGYIIAFGFLYLWLRYVTPRISSTLGITGHVINITTLPFVAILVYGFKLYLSIPVIFAAIKYYERDVPKLPPEEDAHLVKKDPDVIETWKKYKWLKWQVINSINESLFLDTSMIIYQHLGDNNVAFRTVLYNSKVDTDYVTIGDNTILSFETHIYAYSLKEEPEQELTLKRTIIGDNCVIGPCVVEAGVKAGDGVVVGLYARVAEDSILNPGKIYIGNPAKDISTFKRSTNKIGTLAPEKKDN